MRQPHNFGNATFYSYYIFAVRHGIHFLVFPLRIGYKGSLSSGDVLYHPRYRCTEDTPPCTPRHRLRAVTKSCNRSPSVASLFCISHMKQISNLHNRIGLRYTPHSCWRCQAGILWALWGQLFRQKNKKSELAFHQKMFLQQYYKSTRAHVLGEEPVVFYINMWLVYLQTLHVSYN